MRRNLLIVFLLCASVLLINGCSCKHEWQAADCVNPRTCVKCSETEGEALGHDWMDADCTNPKTCSACGETEGEALGHVWMDADCTNPKTCSVCGETEGAALGHDWEAATCTSAAFCRVCGAVGTPALGHTTYSGTCERCGYNFMSPIILTGTGGGHNTGVLFYRTLPKGNYRVDLIAQYQSSPSNDAKWCGFKIQSTTSNRIIKEGSGYSPLTRSFSLSETTPISISVYVHSGVPFSLTISPIN